MIRLSDNHRTLVLTLTIAIVAACLIAPGLIASAHQPAGTSTISHGSVATGVGHALRADGSGALQRSLAVVVLVGILLLGAVPVTAGTAAPAPAPAPGSFERPLRV